MESRAEARFRRASDNPFAWVTLAHLRTQQARHDADQLYAAKRQLTRLLFQHGWRKARIIVLFNVINWMMVLPELLQQQYWRDVLKLEKEQKMEVSNLWEQKFLDKGLKKGLEQGRQEGREAGRKAGREEGREEGRREGALELLERLLVRRFGPLPKTTRSKLAKANLAQLAEWSDALPEATSLKDVFQ